MKSVTRNIALGLGLLVATSVSWAGVFDDLNCGLNSLFGGNNCEIQKINEFQEQKQAEWMRGSITAIAAVKAIVEFHQSLTPIDSYNKEIYLY